MVAVQVIGALVGMAGLAAGGVGLSMWLVGAHRGRLASRLRKAPLMTCREVAEAKFLPRRVVIAGRVVEGSTPPLRGPVSGKPCLWYRIHISGLHDPYRETISYSFAHRAEGMIAIKDHTGTVQVSARVLDRYIAIADIGNDHTCEVPEHFTADKKRHREVCERLRAAGLWEKPDDVKDLSFHEMRVDVGRSITVLGTPRRHGADGWVLQAHRGDGSSVRDLEKLRADADEELVDLRKIVRPASKAAVVLFAVSAACHGLAWMFA